MVHEVSDISEFNNEVGKECLTIVDFYADWCGPCRQIAPTIESFAKKYPECNFIKVNVDVASTIAQEKGIRSMPTFHFYIHGALKGEIVGANPGGIEQKIIELKTQAKSSSTIFSNPGHTLGSVGEINAASAREARLNRFGVSATNNYESKNASNSISSTHQSILSAQLNGDEDEEVNKAIALSLGKGDNSKSSDSKDVATTSGTTVSSAVSSQESKDAQDFKDAENEWEEEMVPVPVNMDLLQQLLDMEIPEVRARKGLVHGSNVEGALDWIMTHNDDPDIDQPYLVRKADTMPKAEMTPEEKAQKLADIQKLIKKRKEERIKKEKEEEIKREKERRERGQQLSSIQEDRDRLQRKREAEKIAKEKKDAERERERLKAEIARDKAIRAANKGVLPSVLGVEGYNPPIIQYDVPTTQEVKAAAATIPKQEKTEVAGTNAVNNDSIDARIAKIDVAIQTIGKYRTGGDGGNALKLLITYIKNIVENPNEQKYKSINTESNAFKSKFTGIVGPSAIFKSLGFEKDAEGTKLVVSDTITSSKLFPLFQTTLNKLIQAETIYNQTL